MVSLRSLQSNVTYTISKRNYIIKPMELEHILKKIRGTWLAQAVEHVILSLRVVSSRPTLGMDSTQKAKSKKPKARQGT